MMESEYSPGVSSHHDNDPFRTMSSSQLDDLDLALDLDSPGVDSTTASPAPAPAADLDGDDDDIDIDPWAVLAAAAGEESPSPPPPSVAMATATTTTTTTLSHAEGEVFAMPGGQQTTSAAAVAPLLLASITAKIHEVDAQVGISARVRDLDGQYHIAERLAHLSDDVLRPAVSGTIEKTREVMAPVVPVVRERWGAVMERASEAHISERLSSFSSAAGAVAAGTAASLGESVARLREELDVKRALANAADGSVDAVGGGGGRQQDNNWRELPGWDRNNGDPRTRDAEGWTGGVSWLQRRIQETRAAQQQQQTGQQWQMHNEQDYSGGGGRAGDPALTRLDEYGLPSSFRRD